MPVVTSKCYKPGDIIHSEKPFVTVIRHDLWDKTCSGCFEIKKDLKKCGACGVMKFCGKNCQKMAWPDHKYECPYLRNYKDFRHQPYVHMIGNIILKLKGKDWKSVTKKIFEIEVSFEDLVSHAGESNHLGLHVDAQGIEEPLQSYIGKENMPDKATTLELFGKAYSNRFGFRCKNSTSNGPDGSALYIGTSKIDHSCVPNAVFYVTGRGITVRAIKAIKELEEITINYRDMITGNQSFYIHQNLKNSFRNCHCVDCSKQFGQSELTRILDMSKASEVIEEADCTMLLMSLLARFNYPVEEIVSRDHLKRILRGQEGVLGRTNLYRMQLLARLYFRNGPCSERIAGLVELAESMKQVWGEYYPELVAVYMTLIGVYMESRRLQEALNYTRKMLMVINVCCGDPFDNSDEAVMARMLSSLCSQFLPTTNDISVINDIIRNGFNLI